MKKLILAMVPALLVLTALFVITGCSKNSNTDEETDEPVNKTTTGYQTMKVEYTIPDGVGMSGMYCYAYFNTTAIKGLLTLDNSQVSSFGTFFIPYDKEFNDLWERYDAYYLPSDKVYSGMSILCRHKNSVCVAYGCQLYSTDKKPHTVTLKTTHRIAGYFTLKDITYNVDVPADGRHIYPEIRTPEHDESQSPN